MYMYMIQLLMQLIQIMCIYIHEGIKIDDVGVGIDTDNDSINVDVNLDNGDTGYVWIEMT